MSNFKKIVAAVLVLAFTIFVAGCGSKTLAKVNGEKITQADMDKRMQKVKLAYEQQGMKFDGAQGQQMLKSVEQQQLDEMINQKLLMQAAQKEGVVATNDVITARFDEIKKNFGSDQKFNDAMKMYGYTEEELREMLKYDITYAALYDKVTKDIKVTDDEVSKYYEQNKDKYKDPEKAKIRHILVAFKTQDGKTTRTDEQAKKEAEKILAELKAGADFATVAKGKSDDGSKTDGGLLKDQSGSDMIPKVGNQFVPEFSNAAFALKAGQMTQTPVKSQFGYHIIKVETKTPEKQLTFEEAKARIQTELPATKKQDAFNKYMEKVRATAKVENNLAAENPPAGDTGSQGGAAQGGSNTQQLPANHPSVEGQSSGGTAPSANE